jgi:hypothetical protein
MSDLTYSTGTCSVAANGTVITGVSTIFSNLREYDFIAINKLPIVPIFGVTDDTHLELKDPWQGGAQTAVSYVAYKISPTRFVGADSAVELSKIATYLNNAGVFYNVPGAAPAPSIGNDGDYALKVNGGGWLLWLRVAGAWVLQATPVGLNYRGEWNAITAFVANDRVSRGGTTYVAKAPSTNQDPATDTTFTYWDGAGIRGSVGPPPTVSGTSSSTVTAGLGTKSFATQAGIAWANGQRVIASNPDSSLVIAGPIASYSGAVLVITADNFTGTGSSNNWTISITGAIGPQGQKGDTGSQGGQGIQGIKGDTGGQGIQGIQGIKGDQGQGLGYDASGTLAQRVAYDNQTQGYRFLQTNISPYLLWIKASNTTADWAGPTPIGATVPVLSMGSIADSVIATFSCGSIA